MLWDIAGRARGYACCVAMVQHEVAQRLSSPPGGRVYGALGAWVQCFARVEYLFKVPPTVFKPRPKVDSAVVRLTPRPAAELPSRPDALALLLKELFAKRRKQLHTILRDRWSQELEDCVADFGRVPSDRPERFAPDELAALAQVLAG